MKSDGSWGLFTSRSKEIKRSWADCEALYLGLVFQVKIQVQVGKWDCVESFFWKVVLSEFILCSRFLFTNRYKCATFRWRLASLLLLAGDASKVKVKKWWKNRWIFRISSIFKPKLCLNGWKFLGSKRKELKGNVKFVRIILVSLESLHPDRSFFWNALTEQFLQGNVPLRYLLKN